MFFLLVLLLINKSKENEEKKIMTMYDNVTFSKIILAKNKKITEPK